MISPTSRNVWGNHGGMYLLEVGFLLATSDHNLHPLVWGRLTMQKKKKQTH